MNAKRFQFMRLLRGCLALLLTICLLPAPISLARHADADKLAPPGFNQSTAQDMQSVYDDQANGNDREMAERHTYQEYTMEYHFDEYRSIYDISARYRGGKISDNQALYQQEWEQNAAFFTDSATQLVLHECGGLEGKSVLDLTPHYGGFSAYAAQQGAQVTALAAGRGHEEALWEQFKEHNVSSVQTAVLPAGIDELKAMLKTPYDIVRINLGRLFHDPNFSLRRERFEYFEFLLRHIAPNALLIVEDYGTCLKHRLNLENQNFYEEWKSKLLQTIHPNIRGVVYDEESEGYFGSHVTAKHRFVACLSRIAGPPLGVVTRKHERTAISSAPYLECSYDPTKFLFTVSDNDRTVQLGLESTPETQGIITALASERSQQHLAFWFEYLHLLLRISQQREGNGERLAARETLRVSGDAMIDSLLEHLDLHPQYIAQALLLVHGLSSNNHCSKEARRKVKRFLKDAAVKHHDALADLLAPPRRIWFGGSTFAIALEILAGEADAKDEDLFLSVLNDSLGPKEGVPSLIYYQERLPDGAAFQCSLTEYDRREARVKAAEALIAIAQKTPDAAVKERIGRGLAETLRSALNASAQKPQKRKLVGPLVTLLGKLGDPQWVDLIKDALAQEMALPSTRRHSRDYFEHENDPGFRAVLAVAAIAKALPDGDQKEHALQWIRSLLDDPVYERAPKIRHAACDVLGDMKDAASRERLEALAMDDNLELLFREKAIEALGRMAHPRSIGAFLRLWDQASEWEITESDFRSWISAMLGSLAKYLEEFRTLDIFTLPESIAAAMQADSEAARTQAAHWLRRFALQDKGSTRFDRVAALLDTRKYAPSLRAELLHERMQAIEKHLPERHWNLLGPIFPQLFGVKLGRGRWAHALKKADFEEFLKRLDMLQRDDAAFGLDSMQKALDQYRDNEHLLRETFAHLLLHASLKESVYGKTRHMRQALEAMGIHYDRLINLADAQKVQQCLAATVPSLSPMDFTSLGSELRAATGHALNEFLDAGKGPGLIRLFADEIVQVFSAQKNPDIKKLWQDFDCKKRNGISFMLAPRDLSFFTWGSRCGDCSALGQQVFWSRPVHLLHPCAWSLLVFFNGKLVDVMDMAIFRAGADGVPVLNVDAHEAVLRSAQGEKADKKLLAARKEILDAAIARVTRLAQEAGIRHAFGAGWSGRENVEDYYRETFRRPEIPMAMELAGGQSLVDDLGQLLSPGAPPAPAHIYLQTTSRAGQHARVRYALDKIEEEIRNGLYELDAWDPLNMAIRTANYDETARLIQQVKEYDALRQQLEPHVAALQEHQLLLADGLRLIYASSHTLGYSLPYHLWSAPGAMQPAALSPVQEAQWQRRMQMEKWRKSIAVKQTQQNRRDVFIAEALLPQYRRLFDDKALRGDLLDLAGEFDPALEKELAHCFEKADTQKMLGELQIMLLVHGYYFEDTDPTGIKPALQLSRITHILTVPGRPAMALKCKPLLGDTSHFISEELGMPVLQPIRAPTMKAARREMQMATAHCLEWMRYAQMDVVRGEALATLAEMALSPQPRSIVRMALRAAMAIAKKAKANKAELLPLSPAARAYQAIALQFFRIVLDVQFEDTALAVMEPAAPGEASRMSIALSPDEIIAYAKIGLDLLKEQKSGPAMRRFAREAYKAISGEDFDAASYRAMRVDPFYPSLFLQGLSNGQAEKLLGLPPVGDEDAFMEHHLLAPRSGFQAEKQTKPQIIPLIAAKPNPDGPFAKGNFDGITDVLVDLRPKEGGGIGDQLLYTPLLLAFLDKFPNAKFTVLANRKNLYDMVCGDPTFEDRVHFMDGRDDAQKAAFWDKVKAMKKGSVLINISETDYPLHYPILGHGIHYAYIETKKRRGDLGFISWYDQSGKEKSGAISGPLVARAINRHEKIEAMLLDLGMEPHPAIVGVKNFLLGRTQEVLKADILQSLGLHYKHPDRKFVVITPTAGAAQRDLDNALILEIIRKLLATQWHHEPMNIIVYGGEGVRAQEKVKNVLQAVQSIAGDRVEIGAVLGDRPLSDYMKLLAVADFHVGPDSFGGHWAKFAGVPSVTVMNDIPASPIVEWMPRGERLYRLNRKELEGVQDATGLADFLLRFDAVRAAQKQQQFFKDSVSGRQQWMALENKVAGWKDIGTTAQARALLQGLEQESKLLGALLEDDLAHWFLLSFAETKKLFLRFLDSIEQGFPNHPKILELEEEIQPAIYYDHLRAAWDASLCAELLRGISEAITEADRGNELKIAELYRKCIEPLSPQRSYESLRGQLQVLRDALRQNPELALRSEHLGPLMHLLKACEAKPEMKHVQDDTYRTVLFILEMPRAIRLNANETSLLFRAYHAIEMRRRTSTGLGIGQEIRDMHEKTAQIILRAIERCDSQILRDSVIHAVQMEDRHYNARTSLLVISLLENIADALNGSNEAAVVHAVERAFLLLRSKDKDFIAALFDGLRKAHSADAKKALVQAIGMTVMTCRLRQGIAMNTTRVDDLLTAFSSAGPQDQADMVPNITRALSSAKAIACTPAHLLTLMTFPMHIQEGDSNTAHSISFVISRILEAHPAYLEKAFRSLTAEADESTRSVLQRGIGRACADNTAMFQSLLKTLGKAQDVKVRELIGDTILAALNNSAERTLRPTLDAIQMAKGHTVKRILAKQIAAFFEKRTDYYSQDFGIFDRTIAVMLEAMLGTQDTALIGEAAKTINAVISRTLFQISPEQLTQLIALRRTITDDKVQGSVGNLIVYAVARSRSEDLMANLFAVLKATPDDNEKWILSRTVVEMFDLKKDAEELTGEAFKLPPARVSDLFEMLTATENPTVIRYCAEAIGRALEKDRDFIPDESQFAALTGALKMMPSPAGSDFILIDSGCRSALAHTLINNPALCLSAAKELAEAPQNRLLWATTRDALVEAMMANVALLDRVLAVIPSQADLLKRALILWTAQAYGEGKSKDYRPPEESLSEWIRAKPSKDSEGTYIRALGKAVQADASLIPFMFKSFDESSDLFVLQKIVHALEQAYYVHKKILSLTIEEMTKTHKGIQKMLLAAGLTWMLEVHQYKDALPLTGKDVDQIIQAIENSPDPAEKASMMDILGRALYRMKFFKISGKNVRTVLKLLRFATDDTLKKECLRVINNARINDETVALLGAETEILFDIARAAKDNELVKESLIALGNTCGGAKQPAMKESQLNVLIGHALGTDAAVREPAIMAIAAIMARNDAIVTQVIRRAASVPGGKQDGDFGKMLGVAIDMRRDMRFNAQHIGELLELQQATADQKRWLLRMLEYLFFRSPESFTPAVLQRIEKTFCDVPESRYLRFYAVMRDVDARAALAKSSFPQHVAVRAILGEGKKKVLIVHNIRDGQGDELIRIGTLAQALLDFNPDLAITLYTARGYLYDNPRVQTLPIEQYQPHKLEVFDAGVFYGGYNPYTWAKTPMGKTPIMIDMSRQGSGLAYENAIRIHQAPVSLIGQMDNMYAPFLKLCAELGLPFRWGTHERPADSLFAGAASEKADQWWQENVLSKNPEKRPAVFYNGFGGETEKKGYDSDQRRKFADDVQDTIDQGFFVILFPNHQPWGNASQAKGILAMLPPEAKPYCIVAPEPKADPLLAKHLVDKSDLVITCEGGMMHLAYNMGKPFVLLQMPGAGEINWWLSRAISYQRVNFMSAPKSVGTLAVETYGRMNGHKIKALPEPERLTQMLEYAA